jgi:hypothetical protein
MLSMSTQNGTQAGAGTLAHDAKWGNIWNSLVAAAGYALVGWLQDFDWTSFPTWAGQIGIPVVGLAVGWLTSKFLPRYKRAS